MRTLLIDESVHYKVTNDLTIICGKCIHMSGSDALRIGTLLAKMSLSLLLPFLLDLLSSVCNSLTKLIFLQ